MALLRSRRVQRRSWTECLGGKNAMRNALTVVHPSQRAAVLAALVLLLPDWRSFGQPSYRIFVIAMNVISTTSGTGTTPKLVIEWEWRSRRVPDLVSFFVENLSTEYISYGEIQCGRALDAHTWSPGLREAVAEEFRSAMSRRGRTRGGRRIAAAAVDRALVGLAVVGFHLDASNPSVVLEDLVIDRGRRGQGLGAECSTGSNAEP